MKQILAVTAFACLVLAVSSAEAGGAADKYGTREPAACAQRNMPLNAQTAAKYLACDMEGESSDMMYLISEVKVQVAPKGRAFQFATNSWSDIDTSKPVYAIRGSYKSWQCSAKQSLSWDNSPGKACNLTDQPQASGTCYMSTFGEWHCHMLDVMHNGQIAHNLPPPK